MSNDSATKPTALRPVRVARPTIKVSVICHDRGPGSDRMYFRNGVFAHDVTKATQYLGTSGWKLKRDMASALRLVPSDEIEVYEATGQDYQSIDAQLATLDEVEE